MSNLPNELSRMGDERSVCLIWRAARHDWDEEGHHRPLRALGLVCSCLAYISSARALPWNPWVHKDYFCGLKKISIDDCKSLLWRDLKSILFLNKPYAFYTYTLIPKSRLGRTQWVAPKSPHREKERGDRVGSEHSSASSSLDSGWNTFSVSISVIKLPVSSIKSH